MSPRARRRLLIVSSILLVATTAIWLVRDWIGAQFTIAVLEWDERVDSLELERVLDTLALQPGDSVADIGSGSGLFTRPLAQRVGPEGLVYAVDIDPILLAHVERTADAAGLENIVPVLAVEDDPMLPAPVDLVLIINTLHHIEGRESYLATLRSYLRPGGSIAIIDFRAGQSPHMKRSLKYDREELEAWLERTEYRAVAAPEFLEENFFLIHDCPSCPAPVN